jgi:hypothetical protein
LDHWSDAGSLSGIDQHVAKAQLLYAIEHLCPRITKVWAKQTAGNKETSKIQRFIFESISRYSYFRRFGLKRSSESLKPPASALACDYFSST